MKVYFVIDGEPTDNDILLLESVKEFAITQKGLDVNADFIGGRPKRH